MHLLFFAFAIIISLLSGILGIKNFDFLETAGVTFTFFILFYSIYVAIKYTSYRQDLSQQQKFIATIHVIKKSAKGNIIWTDSSIIKKIEPLSKKTFDQIEVGDELEVEQTVKSKFLLKLEKQGNSLLNGG